MPSIPVRVRPPVDLADGFAAIRTELGIATTFPATAEAEAEAVGRSTPALARDLTDVDFVTIDPPGARDLDQAIAIERSGRDFVIRYAIADVAAFVNPGGAIDAEAHRRVVTIYLPDENAPLHPPTLSEGAASLLAGQARRALVWRLQINSSGALVEVDLHSAMVRSRAALDYTEVQRLADRAGDVDRLPTRLRDVGEILLGAERDRGGVSLPIPDQEVARDGDGYRLQYRAPLPAEGWNAQVSLLAGRAAAQVMIDGGSGILRTLPRPDDDAIRVLRREARALGVAWAKGTRYPDFIRSLHPAEPNHAALLVQAARLFRGAGYQALGTDDASPPVSHAAVAAPYAHVTAPLRRLVDRYGNEFVLAHLGGRAPADWALAALDALPSTMQRGRSREGSANRMALDLVEAAVLSGRVGSVVRGIVVAELESAVRVQVLEPAVVAEVPARAALGDEVTLRIDAVDVVGRKVQYTIVDAATPRAGDRNL